MRRTRNGAAAVKRTDSPCVDLFAIIGSARQHPAQVLQAFERAYLADPQLALRIALWARDARGGAGERDTFRNILHFLGRKHPEVAAALVAAGTVQRLGRWDDLWSLQGAKSPAVWQAVVAQVRAGLLAEDRLLAKWLPRTGPLASIFRDTFGFSAPEWRRVLAQLSDTVEQRVCAGNWSAVNYAHVPSVAAARYQALFQRHDGYRYDGYLADVKAGRATMKAGTVFPHDVLKAARLNDAAATVQWSQLPRPAVAGNALVLCDVSASMDRKASGSSSAMDICVALGLLLSESLPGPFRNQVLTFTSRPSWHAVVGDTLAERAESLRGADWGGSTNIQAAFDAVLARAQGAAPGFALPETLIVFSDMEFNQADRNKLNHAVMRRKFEAAGFKIPTLVYWNLCGRAGMLPAGNQPGVVMVSGYSAKIADLVLSAATDQLTPERVMRDAVCVPRYDVAGITC